uniref:Uncharacterized protein n=1 Tax=Glossina brevipalpis TaxID=37001 RepID=A0A1A9X541_9MUSC
MMVTLAIMKNAKDAAKTIRQGDLPVNLIGIMISGLLAMAILATIKGQNTETIFIQHFCRIVVVFQCKDFPGGLQHTKRQKKNSTEIPTGKAQINMSSKRTKNIKQCLRKSSKGCTHIYGPTRTTFKFDSPTPPPPFNHQRKIFEVFYLTIFGY